MWSHGTAWGVRRSTERGLSPAADDQSEGRQRLCARRGAPRQARAARGARFELCLVLFADMRRDVAIWSASRQDLTYHIYPFEVLKI